MNWAAKYELPEGQKTPHRAVDYEHPSRDPDKTCDVCRNFIPGKQGSKNRCRTVQPPIEREDWCVRYDPKEDYEE